ncbi:hypothetical protein ColTof4_07558 [Colletotrichum tofieldiae]|nr:hypothetical protein ColTof3_12511 [Colletotrichum tofieldiae]GKT75135.1 hypothetical protein ColTof4_07558 [Colletotrichum tofieldiae]GKT92374.1 hypothetical protein Ct61P_10224 [Colletotrichum tofieldiae]
MVSFVVSGKGEPIVETACVQLWVPKQLDGQLVTNNESLVGENTASSIFGNRYNIETEHPPWPLGHGQSIYNQSYRDGVDVEQHGFANGACSAKPIDSIGADDQ